MSYFGIPIRNGLPIGLGSVAPLASGGGSPFSPLSLFASGAPGAWYDPSDYTTLFQDSAGTTPVTAVEQPVGRMLDKSGNGNHAFQATSASRPVLSARYNLHTKTDFLSGANGWLLNGTPTITSDADVPAGQGFTNSTKIVTTGTFQGPYQNVTTVGTSNKKGVWLKGGAGGEVVGITDNGNTGGTVVLTTDWVFYTKTWTTVDAASGILISASGKTVYVAGVDVRSATQSSSLPAYQRVNTATDYNSTGFLPYLKFDGVDDSLSTNSISFTSTDKMSVFAGVRKLSDVAIGMVAELSANSGSGNNGAFGLRAPYNSATADYGFLSNGTAAVGAVATSFIAPITNVVTGLGNISGPSATLRVNASQVATVTSSQGTGNYGNYPLYIGRRNNASLPFNGQLYSMVIVGKAVTAGELSSTETWVNSKTGAYA